MPSHHFNGQGCYLFQIIFQSHNNCLITKLFQGVFCHDITKLLTLAQNDVVLFYFGQKCFGVPSKPLPPPSFTPNGRSTGTPPLPLVTSMLAPPASVCGIAHAWQLNLFLKMLAALMETFAMEPKQAKALRVLMWLPGCWQLRTHWFFSNVA